MPPVSLPLNGGTVSNHGSAESARAGAHASTPHMATRHAAPVIRIADSISLPDTLKRNHGQEKNGGWSDTELSAGCCRVALDRVRASRHRPPVGSPRRTAHARPHHIVETTRSCGRDRYPVRPAGTRPRRRGRQSGGAEFRPVRPAL